MTRQLWMVEEKEVQGETQPIPKSLATFLHALKPDYNLCTGDRQLVAMP